MFELAAIKSTVLNLVKALYCHRAIYAGLALCHGSECVASGKFEIYGVMALCYALLALRG